MSKKGSPALIGAFVLGGVFLAVLAIGFFGARDKFEPKLRFVCYFPGSVNGLFAGSAVKVRGVAIGSVFDMRIRYRQRPEDTRVPIFIEVGTNRLRELGVPRPEERLGELIQQGLRARLRTESLITGQLYVDLDFHPGTEARFAEVDRHGAYREVPTIPTEIEELGRTLRQLAAAIIDADIPGVMRSIRSASDGAERLLASERLARTLEAVPPALASVERAADRVGEQAAPLGSSMREAVADIRRAVDALNGTLVDTRALVAPEGAASVRLESALQSLDGAAHSVQELADFLRRNPNALIVGKKD